VHTQRALHMVPTNTYRGQLLRDESHTDRNSGTGLRWIAVVDVHMHRKPSREERGAAGGAKFVRIHSIELQSSTGESVDIWGHYFFRWDAAVVPKV
jgi:hypothetical protein